MKEILLTEPLTTIHIDKVPRLRYCTDGATQDGIILVKRDDRFYGIVVRNKNETYSISRVDGGDQNSSEFNSVRDLIECCNQCKFYYLDNECGA